MDFKVNVLHVMYLVRRKKILVVPVPDRPYFFLPTIGSTVIDRATLFPPSVCGLQPQWRVLSHQLLKIPEKNIQKKNFRPTDPNFFVI
jgi:hypothetical protein